MNNVVFTLVAPCPIKCVKYCPQEVLNERYTGVKAMTLETFGACLANLPRNTDIHLAGFSEPTMHQLFVDFVLQATKAEKVTVYSTLSGLKLKDMQRIAPLIDELNIHVPDGEVFKMPDNPEYKDVFFHAVTNISNVTFSIMNERFTTNSRENTARGKPGKRRFGRCIQGIQPIIMPNGDAYLCCMDFGLQHKVGNLAQEKYGAIAERIKKGKWSLCRTCLLKTPFGYTTGRKLLRKVIG